jgi:hypothetical protein
MFSLLLVLVSILLVAVLVLATLWFGGGGFTGGQESATAARVVNESAQIQGAVESYKVNNSDSLPSSMTDLINGGYLNGTPSASWSFATDSVQSSILDQTACLRADKMLGFSFSTVPGCSLYPNTTVCCDPSS